ncbi:triphosphoribosyl-dephospho-CoA synthase [Candidatus Methanoperedens nitratireducens]|uniref:Putative triphosphoribosyl-dephospho-CoA synthase n=1 Tax=Candidatus Methanoperedens nitratireducens TaxID=1392998 RepID=A0A284VN27_9EURY|nr:triphosphoribosyl-dephospho-CoA synthase [Candidatus Methanoperedens nitroreducens]SNQ60686.1 putative triphosphoribosyl-dephospho-CoA synthase [Candidatus Methanoperedens nitroreducens]
MSPSHIARCTQLAMLLEVSATPKPGNIDRDHNYTDTRFEHFLASAVGVYPVLEKAAHSKSGIGALIHEAVKKSTLWQKGGNTHFGAFILLIPLVMAAGKCENETCLKAQVQNVVKETTVEDAIEFYRAFSEARVKVKTVDDLALGDAASIDKIRAQGLTLFNMMEISSSYDMLANEWVNGFQKTFECSGSIRNKIKNHGINDAVVLTFMELLSSNKDTFIQTKFDSKKAEQVSMRAREILQKADMGDIRDEIHSFDNELLKEGINPGSTADIIIAGLFVALFEGMRF